MSFQYEYPHPAVTVDCVVFGLDTKLNILLIRRGVQPYQNRWALPGGFVRIDESIEDAAARELLEETGLSNVFLEQLYTFGAVERDPRERVISVAYFALVNKSQHNTIAATDASESNWFPIDELPELAFDHQEIFQVAHERLKSKVQYQPIGLELLPNEFTLTGLQTMYETILDRTLDKRNFRKKVLATELLKETGKVEQNVSHRAAKLYRFDMPKYMRMHKRGFFFEI